MRIAAAALLLCALSVPAAAQSERRPLAQADEKTRLLVEKVVASIGGAERIDRLRSFAMTAKMSGPPEEDGTPGDGTITLIVAVPDKIYMQMAFGETVMTVVVTPDHAFITAPDFPIGAGVRLKEKERNEFLELLYSHPIYLLTRRRHSAVSFAHAGRRTLNGKDVEMLEIGGPTGMVTWAIDAQSGRPLAELEQGGVTELSNWKNVKGIYVAARQVSRKLGQAEPTVAIITAADVDMAIDDSLFKPPSTWVMRGD